MLKSLADAERFLEREPIACIATVDSEGKAHVVPVWFTYDNGKVHIQTDRKSVKVVTYVETRVLLWQSTIWQMKR